MRALITGMRGTVAPALAARLRAAEWSVVRWDRATMPIEKQRLVREAIDRVKPDWVCHLATGPVEWAEWIARTCAERGIRLLWTGSVSIFSPAARAPLTPTTPPDATDDYGKYKIECERRLLAAMPSAIVARLGWQIADAPGSNTMTDFLHRAAIGNGGDLDVSTRWVPSCAFVDDSAEALWALMQRGEPGTYNIEGNTAGLSLFDLAAALARTKNFTWKVHPSDEPIRDNRMQDDRVPVRQVKDRLN